MELSKKKWHGSYKVSKESVTNPANKNCEKETTKIQLDLKTVFYHRNCLQTTFQQAGSLSQIQQTWRANLAFVKDASPFFFANCDHDQRRREIVIDSVGLSVAKLE